MKASYNCRSEQAASRGIEKEKAVFALPDLAIKPAAQVQESAKGNGAPARSDGTGHDL
jgi:hypothetical protein